MSDNQQFRRRIGLIVGSQNTDIFGNPGDEVDIDLSQTKIVFKVSDADNETPSNCFIRIYNLAEKTVTQILKLPAQYGRVRLQAGYVDNDAYGPIFDGTILYVRRGRENPTDTYTDIIGATYDEAYNFSVVNRSLAANLTDPVSQINLMSQAMAPQGVTGVTTNNIPVGPVLLRGKAFFGLTRAGARSLARTLQATWTVKDGKLTFTAFNTYAPGEAVVLNSKTGMIGIPTQTNNGIQVRCLLNPKIDIGGLVQINDHDIQAALLSPAFTAQNNQPAIANNDGFYKALVVEHTGDTRGNDWYTDITCIALANQPVNQSVALAGAVNTWIG